MKTALLYFWFSVVIPIAFLYLALVIASRAFRLWVGKILCRHLWNHSGGSIDSLGEATWRTWTCQRCGKTKRCYELKTSA